MPTAPLIVWCLTADPGTPSRRVFTLSLVRRAAFAAHAAGFDQVAVAVHPGDEDWVRGELGADARLPTTLAVVAGPAAPSAALAALGADAAEEVVVAQGDRVFARAALTALAAPLASTVRARLVEDMAVAAPSAGLARVRRADLDRLPLAAGLSPEAVAAAVGVAPAAVELASAVRAHAVRGPKDVTAAETVLLRALIKPTDGVISRNLNRHISLSITRHLARTSLRPNHVTTVVFLVGILAGPLASQGNYLGFMLGGLCYYVAAVLDGCDGELSRINYLGSPLGIWLDTLTDDAVALSYVAGMYVGLARYATHPYWIWLGGVTVSCYLLSVLPRYYLFVAKLGVGDHQYLAAWMQKHTPAEPAGLVKKFTNVVSRTDFLSFYAFVTALVGLVPVFAVTHAIGTMTVVVDTVKTLAMFRRVEGGAELAGGHSRK